MFQQPEVLRMAQGMAVHAAARQQAIAANIANADTPGYRARDLAPFADSLDRPDQTLTATRAGHLMQPDEARGPAFPAEDRGTAAAPNGNTVAIEVEMAAAVDARRQHDQALAIYRASLTLLRSALGKG
ncbi:FlgB family protein [Frigidibacter oleivorans]|uniref:FlgB family protein n=1 Tax=Frigidibacter oleivorans TaxID=2487129 RepID=UPI000F8D7868|nr:FlgB family protein [Frigidibacter oleivorans]